MDKARKIHQRLYQIQEFEMPSSYDGADGEVIQQSEIVDIINALKMQHEFINETEATYQLYSQVKNRAEAFFQYEFCKVEAKEEKSDDSWLKSVWNRFLGPSKEEGEVITDNNFITRLAE